MEWLARREGDTVEVRGAKNEGPRRIGEAARSVRFRLWMKDAHHAQAIEDQAESTAQNVGRLPRCKADGIARAELESQRVQAEPQNSLCQTGGHGPHLPTPVPGHDGCRAARACRRYDRC